MTEKRRQQPRANCSRAPGRERWARWRVSTQAKHTEQGPLRRRKAGQGTAPGLLTKSKKESDVLSLLKTLKSKQSLQTWPCGPQVQTPACAFKEKAPV